MAHGNSLDVRSRAQEIAKNALRTNVTTLIEGEKTKQYLLAGSRQYKSLWARDMAFASLGAVHVGLDGAVRDSLEAFFAIQKADGLLPRLIDRYDVFRRVLMGLYGAPLDWGKPFQGWYHTEHGVVCGDSNLLIPFAAGEYLKSTQDREFASRWYPNMEKALAFVEAKLVQGGLIGKQPPYSDWADSIARKGRVGITNIFYILALRSARDWSSFLGLPERAREYGLKADSVTQLFQENFWVENLAVVRNFDGNTHVTADANLFAVAFNILSVEQASRVMDHLRKTPIWNPMPGRPTWPSYPSSLKSWTVRMVNLGDYHDELYWLWITALAARAEKVVGNRSGYEEILNSLAGQICDDGAIHEVYSLNQGRLSPVRRTLYRAEAPFSWSAGMYLWAENQE